MPKPETEKKELVNTNDEVVRIQRALNQFEFYGIDAVNGANLETIIGLPLNQRLAQVRQALFPKKSTGNEINFEQVDTNVDFQQVCSRKRWIPGKFYPDIELVKNELLPSS